MGTGYSKPAFLLLDSKFIITYNKKAAEFDSTAFKAMPPRHQTAFSDKK
jgi:hypothetical protein